MALLTYAPGTQETDLKKIIMSLQQVASKIGEVDESITPTWTGQHEWNGGGIFLGAGASPSPPFSVGTGTNPYFGSDSNTWQLINSIGNSATVPEVGLQSIMNGANGSANPHTAFKIALFAAGTFGSSSADGYCANFVAASTAGFSGLLTGLEVDLNQGSGLAQGNPGAANASYNIVLSGNPLPSHPATAAIYMTGSSLWQNGIFIKDGVVNNAITDSSSSGISFVVAGSHTYAMDTTQGTFSQAVIHLGNNQKVSWLNAAGNADLQGVSVNASDQLVLGGAGITDVKFNSSANFTANGATFTPAFGTTAPAFVGTPGSVNKWLKILDDTGAPCWIPVWK